jgi:hypothetical protein
MLHDVGSNLTMPRQRRIEMDFRLKCWSSVGSPDQVDDRGLDGLNVALRPSMLAPTVTF